MFHVQKSEFKLESVRVRSLKKLNHLLFLVAAIITFMSLKIEKQNMFFIAVLERARGIKERDKIKMYLYRFIAGMKAIFSRDSHGIQHFKYKE